MPSLPAYLASTAWVNPVESSRTLFNYHVKTPLSMYEWLQTQPRELAGFGATMAAANKLKLIGVLKTLSESFPRNSDSNGESVKTDVLLVDVGGGKGRLIERFRKERPDLMGRMILQDLPGVVEGRGDVEGVEYMAHDFFTPQPITGQFSEVNQYHDHEINTNHL